MPNVETIEAPGISGSYSETTAHATKAGGFIFVTGQCASKPGGDFTMALDEGVEMGTIEEQTTRVLDNIKAILEEAGSDFAHVVKRNVYITSETDFAGVYKVMERYFTTGVASTGVIAGLLPFSARIEIDVIAVVPD
jgi:2-iminobutanoate/2-iminopropanoate deaminase